MHYNAGMRTTVELSDSVYRRLKAVAVDRGLRGLSPIVEEALSEYLQSSSPRPLPVSSTWVPRARVIANLKQADAALSDELARALPDTVEHL
jgi:hypothetical protein